MTKSFIFLLAITIKASTVIAQVGIGTDTPQAMLDINGNLRIRQIDTGPATADSLLVIDNQNIVSKVAIADVMQNGSQVSFVKGTGGASILLGIDILTGWKTIGFNNVEFDLNNDYNTATYQFTAPKTGIYKIYAQYRTSSLLSAGNLGIGIFKQTGTNTPILIAEESYLQVGVDLGLVTIEVSPPVRKTQTLVQLNTGDKIFFGSRVPIVNLTLLGGPQSFFTINQVR